MRISKPAWRRPPPDDAVVALDPLGRLEEQASHLYCYADIMAELLTYLAQAGLQAALAPEVLQPLCTAVWHSLEDLAQQVPRRSTSDATQDAMVKAMMTTLSVTIQVEVPEPSIRTRLNTAIHRVLQDAAAAERRGARRQTYPSTTQTLRPSRGVVGASTAPHAEATGALPEMVASA